jgi:transcriptional regulator
MVIGIRALGDAAGHQPERLRTITRPLAPKPHRSSWMAVTVPVNPPPMITTVAKGVGLSHVMYLPPHFREDRLEVQHQLISAGPNGLMANSIPFLIVPEASERGTLRCHVSRANPQWRDLMTVEECLVVFQGPHDYVTPSWYQTKRDTGKVVPTWNYVTVHAWGRPHVIEDEGWLRQQIEALTRSREAARTPAWHVSDAPADYVSAQIKGIIGIEIPIARSEGKWKMSQNRSEVDRNGVIAGYREQGDAGTAMAEAMIEANPRE